MRATITPVAAEAVSVDGNVDRSVGGQRLSAVGQRLARLATWRFLLGVGVVFVAFAGALFMSSAPFSIAAVEEACGASPPDVRFFSTADEVDRFLDGCGSEGRNAYRNLQLADLAYPAVFGLFMASSLALVLRRLFPHRLELIGLSAIALVGSGFDYAENALAWVAWATFPDPASSSFLLGPASAGKNLAFWIAGAGLFAGLVVLSVRSAMDHLRRISGGQATPAGDDQSGRRDG